MSLESVRAEIQAAEQRSERTPGSTQLVVVTKNRSIAEIHKLYQQGHTHFGENRAQELADKAAQLPTDICWHFIGSLQTNKVRMVRPVANYLHSLDRLKLAEAWLKGPGFPPPALVQVNISDEPQKHGFGWEDTPAAVEQLLEWRVPVVGLMGMAEHSANPDSPRHSFTRLRKLRDLLKSDYPNVAHLSMGMSQDYVVAVEEGATMIRVGQAIFIE